MRQPPTAYIAPLATCCATLRFAVIVLSSISWRPARAERWPLLNSRPGNVLTLILTDCGKYQDWQAVAAAFAWRRSGQGGSLVRIANCKDEDVANYNHNMLEYMHTHMAPLFAWSEELKDWYVPYNKPGAVIDYFEHYDPKEEYVVILDPDMLVRRPFDPSDLPLKRGWAYAADYNYLVGTENAMALRHVPEVLPRNDTKAGNVGRRGDRVGAPYYMHKDDLRKVAPQWYNYTRIVRADMEAYQDSGDTASKEGERIWIAEMYGYVYGAAMVDVWHTWKDEFMLYPTYTPSKIPYTVHYGLNIQVGNWSFYKHHYFDFDSHKCPPWDLDVEKPYAGIFPPPPGPDQIKGNYMSRYTDLFAVSTIAIVNAALCDYHVRNCPPSPQLTRVCNQAFSLYWEVDQAVKDIEWDYDCTDHEEKCSEWASGGKCVEPDMQTYMHRHCAASCGVCLSKGARVATDEDVPMTVEALSREVGKQAAADDDVDVDNTSERPQAARDISAASDQHFEFTKTATSGEQHKNEFPAHHRATLQSSVRDELGDHSDGTLKRYPRSTLSYTGLIKRCLELQGLGDEGIRECVGAADHKLEYPGLVDPKAALTTAAIANIADAAALLQTAASTLQEAAAAAAATSDGTRADKCLSLLQAQQLHSDSEHVQCQQSSRTLFKALLCTSTGSMSFVEQVAVTAVAVGIAWCLFTKLYR